MNQHLNEIAVLRRKLLLVAAILGALAVLAGAFGAHALSTRVPARMLDVWSTGVRYQMWHVLALLAAATMLEHFHLRTLRAAGYAWIAGIVVFSGSLYLLVLGGYTAFGALTPVGGGLLIGGWILFAIAVLRGAHASTAS